MMKGSPPDRKEHPPRRRETTPFVPFTNGSDAVKFLFGPTDRATTKACGLAHLLDLNLPDMSGSTFSSG
jgi:hypothetical protein